MDVPVATAASIVLGNLKTKRIPADEGALLLCSAIVEGKSARARALAEEKEKALAKQCEKVILERVSELAPLLHVLPGITDPKTKKFSSVK